MIRPTVSRPTVSRALVPAALALGVMLLGACGSVHEQEGRGYMPPSEVTASRAIPLTVPPEYGLRPENPNQAESTVIADDTVAAEIDVTMLDATMGEQNLLVRAGVLEADPGIRRTLNHDNALLAGDPELVDVLLFGDHSGGGAVEIQEGPEIGSDVAIEQGTPIEDDSWFDSVFGIF